MVSRKVYFGSVGVSISGTADLVLLQATDDADQARISLTPEQTETLIERLRDAMARLALRKKNPDH